MRCAYVALLLFVAQSAWAKPNTATVTVNCQVVGATVSVDGVEVGTTPVPPLVLSTGIHTIRVVRAGAIDFSQEFMLRAGDETVIIAASKTALSALDLDLDADPPPAKHVPVNSLDLDLPEEAAAVPVPPKPAPVEESLPPPPVPEPPPLPKITVRRVEPSPPPAVVSRPAPITEAPPPSASAPWAFSAGLAGGVGGMSATAANGLSVSDGGSGAVGGLFVAEWARWEGRLSVEHVFQDRWLAANVRSDGAWSGGLHVGRWLWSPVRGVLLGVLAGGGYRAHVAPDGAWWATRGPSPSEWRLDVVPSVVWRAWERVDVAVSVPFGYGFGAVDARAWRNFGGPFATFECAFRYAFAP